MSRIALRIVAAGIAVSLAFAPAGAAPRGPELKSRVPATRPAKAVPPGYFDFRNGVVGYVPPGLKAGVPAPLLVLLHGARGDGVDMVERFRPEADLRGIVLLAPRAGGRTWDSVMNYNPDYGKFASTAVLPPNNPPMPFDDDVGRVDDAIGLVLANVPVDPERIALLGFSDGATYALALGTRNPELFRTVIALSPGFAFPTKSKGRQRVLVTHGTRDRVLPFIGSKRDIVPNLERNGHDVTFVKFNGGHELPPDILTQAMDFFLAPAD